MKEKKTKNFTVRITPTMFERLEKEAKRLEKSKGEIVRNSIEAFLIELF